MTKKQRKPAVALQIGNDLGFPEWAGREADYQIWEICPPPPDYEPVCSPLPSPEPIQAPDCDTPKSTSPTMQLPSDAWFWDGLISWAVRKIRKPTPASVLPAPN
ncbi:hypothetical protein BGX38DRAFT_1154371 [Terfezia claveryi]|nr:hypothetical protein BGX38DRAFT_1154371 [Terfezia claveryi]